MSISGSSTTLKNFCKPPLTDVFFKAMYRSIKRYKEVYSVLKSPPPQKRK